MDRRTKAMAILLAAAILASLVVGYRLIAAANRLGPPPEAAAEPPAQATPQEAAPAEPGLTIDGMTPDEQMMRKVARDIQMDIKDLK